MSMLRLSPLPDESAMGFMGRVQRLNGWTSERNAREWLFQWAASERPSDGPLCLVEVLAMVAGIDITSFVRDHTTLSFRRAVVISQTEVLHGSPSHRQLLEKRALCDARPGAYFCRECVKEDCDFHGAPYWRRSHQLPGVFWCQKHACALSMARPVRAMHSLPTDFLEDCEEVSGEWVEELKEFEGIRNFLAISNDLLMRPRPLDELHVARAVRARCLELERRNVREATQSQRQIRDLIEAKFEARWLEKVSVEVGILGLVVRCLWVEVDGRLIQVDAVSRSRVDKDDLNIPDADLEKTEHALARLKSRTRISTGAAAAKAEADFAAATGKKWDAGHRVFGKPKRVSGTAAHESKVIKGTAARKKAA